MSVQQQIVPVQGLSLAPVFTNVPPFHGVAALDGLVVVYEEEAFRRDELEHGAFYVMEYQTPRAGMTWEMFHRYDSRRVVTKREVVRARRCSHREGYWWLDHANTSQKSGPMLPLAITDTLVGRVVGVYGSTDSPNVSQDC